MNPEIIGLSVVILINVIVVAYSYGKLTQKVSRGYNDISHLEKKLDKLDERLDNIDKRLIRMENK